MANVSNENELKEVITGESFKEKAFEDKIKNAYFFGQFMQLHILLHTKELKGNNYVWNYVEKKYRDIGMSNPVFVSQAAKMDSSVESYVKDSLETNFQEGK